MTLTNLKRLLEHFRTKKMTAQAKDIEDAIKRKTVVESPPVIKKKTFK